jgi:transcriptional regulator with XRE-family HTH domain
MGSRHSADEEGRRRWATIRTRIGTEIRTARRVAGASQAAAAQEAGMSRSQFGRVERGELRRLSFEQACRAAAAVGLDVSVRTFPDGDPVRDAGQLRLLERFRGLLPLGATWRTEVPLPIPGDRRAWDATLQLLGRRAGCEAETKTLDIQALERRLALKLRDGEVDVLIVIVADTPANRKAIALHRVELRALLTLDSREVMGACRRGRVPGASGLVML